MANTRTVAAGGGADHTTIGSAISWFQSNHDFDTDGIGTIEITDSSAYSENITISGIAGTASISAYLKITVTSGNRHGGVAGGGAKIASSTSGQHIVTISEDYTFIEHLEIEQQSGGASDEGIRITSGTDNVLLSRNIIWTNDVAIDMDGVYMGNWGGSVSLDNCILYGWNRGGLHAQNYGGAGTQTWNIDHCTIYDCGDENTTDAGGVAFRNSASATLTMNIYNTAVLDSSLGASEDYRDRSFSGTSTVNGSHNIDSDGSVTGFGAGTSAQQNLTIVDTTQSSGSYFVVNSITGGSEDLTLLDDAAGNLAFENGTDRTGSEPDSRQDFSLDIAGNVRGASPDIGASEYTAVGGDINVNTSVEALTITENAADITLDVNVKASTESLTITEYGATIALGVDVSASTESLTITTQPATVGLDVVVNAATEALTITSYQAVVDVGGITNVLASTEALTITTNQASISHDVNVACSTESLTLTTQAASTLLGTNVEASVASLTITEQAASITHDVNVESVTEALTITTNPATIVSSGATTLTPQDITNIVDALFAKVIENGETFEQQLKLIRAEAAGKVAVSGSTVTFRDAADSKDRITATVDSNGQRTAITTDVS